MTEVSDLTRTLHQLADALRGLTTERLTHEERATVRAVLVELTWLAELPLSEGESSG